MDASLLMSGYSHLVGRKAGSIKAFMKEEYGRIRLSLEEIPSIRVGLKQSKSSTRPISVAIRKRRKFPTEILDESDPTLYVTKSFCVLSHYPMYSVFKTFLTELYRLTLSTLTIPIERYICNFMLEVPLPPPGRIEVSYTIGTKNLIISRPPINQFPICDVPFERLFQLLSVDTILFLFNCIIQEQQILIYSRQYSNLGSVLEALTSFMYPFVWHHVYIPLLPKECAQFIHAPVPFLMGAHVSTVEGHQMPNGIIIVDLDTKSVKKTGDSLAPLPEKEMSKLRKSLKEILGKYEFKTLEDHDLAVPLAPSSLLSNIHHGEEEFPKEEVRAAFYRFFLSIFKDYKNYLIKHTLSQRVDDPNHVFNVTEFIREHISMKDFLGVFLQTQAWHRFVIEVVEGSAKNSLHTSVRMFDEHIIEKTNRSKLKLIKEETPFLKSQEYNINKRVVIPPPLDDGIQKDRLYRYKTFPILNPLLCHEPKIPEILVKKDEVSDPKTIDSWKTILTTLSVLSHPQAIESLSKTYETRQGGGFAGTFLFVETKNYEVLDAFSKYKIDSLDVCGECQHYMTDGEIRKGWSTNSNDYRTTCPKCTYKFVARFTIRIQSIDDVGDKYEYLSFPILTKEITNLMKKEVIADANLFRNHPVIFWNIILHLRELKIPLNFLLPQMDWTVLVDSCKRKMKSGQEFKPQSPNRKILPRIPQLDRISSMQTTPRYGDDVSQDDLIPLHSPNTSKPRSISPSKFIEIRNIDKNETPLKKNMSLSMGKPLPKTPKNTSPHRVTNSMDFSLIPIGIEMYDSPTYSPMRDLSTSVSTSTDSVTPTGGNQKRFSLEDYSSTKKDGKETIRVTPPKTNLFSMFWKSSKK